MKQYEFNSPHDAALDAEEEAFLNEIWELERQYWAHIDAILDYTLEARREWTQDAS